MHNDVMFYDSHAISTEEGDKFIPFLDHNGMVGYQVIHRNGKVSYLMLNPSTATEGANANVFLYEGTEPDLNDPDTASITYIDVEPLT